MVIPRSLSKSLESMIQSTTSSLSLKTSLCLKNASTNVLFPASTWAMTAMFKIFSLFDILFTLFPVKKHNNYKAMHKKTQ